VSDALDNPLIFKGEPSWNLRSHFQFYGVNNAADAHVWAVVVARP
jgi:hypothetical protein